MKKIYILLLILILIIGFYFRFYKSDLFPGLHTEEATTIDIIDNYDYYNNKPEVLPNYVSAFLYFKIIKLFWINIVDYSLVNFRLIYNFLYIFTGIIFFIFINKFQTINNSIITIFVFSFITVYLAWTRVSCVMYPFIIFTYLILLNIFFRNNRLKKILSLLLIIFLISVHFLGILYVIPLILFVVYKKKKYIYPYMLNKKILLIGSIVLIFFITVFYFLFLNLNIFVKMQPSVNRYFFGLARYIFVVVETINGNLVCRHFSGFYLNPTISFLVSAIVLIYIFYIYFVKLKNKTDLDYLSLITFFSIVILAPFLKEVFQNQGSFNHIFTHRYLIIISVPFSIILGRVIGYLLFSKKNLYVLFSIILLIYYPFIFIYNYIIPFEKYGGKFKTSSGYSWNLQSTLIRNDYGEVQFLISNEGQPLEIALKKIIKDNELKKIILDDFYMSNIIEFYSKIHKVNYPIYKLPNPPKSQLTTNFSIETLINSNINIDEVTLYIFSYNKTNYHFSSFLNLNFDETMLLTPYFIVLKKDGSELLNVYKIKLSKLIYKNLLLKK